MRILCIPVQMNLRDDLLYRKAKDRLDLRSHRSL